MKVRVFIIVSAASLIWHGLAPAQEHLLTVYI